jgi:hypothetical protein
VAQTRNRSLALALERLVFRTWASNAVTIADKLRRRPLTAQEHSDRDELKAFRPAIDRSDSRNWKSQVLLVLALGATFVGAWLSVVGNLAGFVLVVVGLPATVATGMWCFRNWDY